MTAITIETVIHKAQEKCHLSGVKLTDKRKKILELMLASETPLSPYQVVEQYNAQSEKNMPANSAYRILDFLVAENLAHKLNSANKYIACSHIACDHAHDVPQFLICRKCSRVKEIMVKQSLIHELKQNVHSAGYQLLSSHLELDCLCPDCKD